MPIQNLRKIISESPDTTYEVIINNHWDLVTYYIIHKMNSLCSQGASEKAHVYNLEKLIHTHTGVVTSATYT